jgi:hypothetical protein
VWKVGYSVNLAGYIWQRYDKTETKEPPGIVFPDVVYSAGGILPSNEKLAYRKIIGNKEVSGWKFEMTLRQSFDYKKYPLDHKTVWIRMWPSRFLNRILLFPDYRAYQSTELDDLFGFGEDIFLGGWQIEETFFEYHLPVYL